MRFWIGWAAMAGLASALIIGRDIPFEDGWYEVEHEHDELTSDFYFYAMPVNYDGFRISASQSSEYRTCGDFEYRTTMVGAPGRLFLLRSYKGGNKSECWDAVRELPGLAVKDGRLIRKEDFTFRFFPRYRFMYEVVGKDGLPKRAFSREWEFQIGMFLKGVSCPDSSASAEDGASAADRAKKKSRRSLIWALCIALPALGLLVYALFRYRKLRRRVQDGPADAN
ncbi:hypothetical protein PAPHI01_1353 [Pancytospora philotis]|nr:hypothetical protein PAPHI01_1353 [Pancytospora philotis]